MTPEQKALELVEYFTRTRSEKFSDFSYVYWSTAKVFAIKVCCEMLFIQGSSMHKDYWVGVKQEIEKL